VAGMTGGREEKKVEKFRVFCFGLGGEVEDEEDECDFFTLFFFFSNFLHFFIFIREVFKIQINRPFSYNNIILPNKSFIYFFLIDFFKISLLS
jgi:hypothetical protein